jgi:UDP-N-acetylglucosamine--N-acetylmuramyl-(pentapeptide) pyrophosphoryl-undecaprenol N-acetylglucosamine transferase
MKKIILTGGGTAGHVTPNMALLPRLKELDYDVHYIGSYDGIERKLIEEMGIPYDGISSGKLRRYLSLKNFTDPFRVIKGFAEAKQLIKDFAPDVVFSKGGFVSVPVVMAAAKLGIPVIIHESDMTPGLANKLAIPKATKVCHNFPETAQYIKGDKCVLTGTPIRKELFSGSKLAGLQLCGFTANKPVLMVVGGSLGSVVVNDAVREALPELLKEYQVVHLCGKGKLDASLEQLEGYKQFDYIKGEMKDLFAMSDLVISRAGANAISEILALKKPSILIPLSAKASRGDQILNAQSFEKLGYSYVIEEESLTPDTLINAIKEVSANRDTYMAAIESSPSTNAIDIIIGLIEEAAGEGAN